MDGGSRWWMRADGRRLPRMRPAAMYMAAGTLLTLLTILLGISNAISAQQTIALALLATVAMLRGVIRMIVPDAWIAWRQGFQHGCQVGISCQASHLDVMTAPDTIPLRSGEPMATDLLARSRTRARRRIGLADGS
jgi:hypothetical protein